MSETIVSQSAKQLRNAAPVDEQVDRNENIVLLGKSAAIISINLADGVPTSVSDSFASHLNERSAQLLFYHPIRQTSDLDAFFDKNNALGQLKTAYFESLTQVSVSNKDISNPMGKALGVENLIVFQIDRWPCDGCTAPLRIRIKMRVIDLPTGLIIWTGINETAVDRIDEGSFEKLASLSDELLYRFQHRFERKWHRKRYRNLSFLAQK